MSGATLGVGIATVASCDSDGVTLAYNNSFDNTAGTYTVTAVTVSNINVAGPSGCVGKLLDVTLKDATGAGIGTGQVTIGGPIQTLTIAGNTSAANVVGAAVVIADN